MSEKMPDEIRAWYTDGGHTYWTKNPKGVNRRNGDRYLRAEPIKALMKQARDALDAWDEDFAPTPNDYLDLIETIDKFLGERK